MKAYVESMPKQSFEPVIVACDFVDCVDQY